MPVKLPEGQSAIQILYNFQVLISVAPGGVKPKIMVQGAEIGGHLLHRALDLRAKRTGGVKADLVPRRQQMAGDGEQGQHVAGHGRCSKKIACHGYLPLQDSTGCDGDWPMPRF